MALSKAAQDIENEFAEYEARRAIRLSDSWRPEPGTRFKGEVIGLRMGGKPVEEGGYGFYPVIVYKNLADNSTIAVHAFHTVLREKYVELKTDIGKQQFISYLGQKPSNTRKDKDGKPVEYHLYDVENVGDEQVAKEEGFSFMA